MLPKQLKKHGLNPDDVKISDAVLMEIVNDYTREAGVRNLERRLADVCRYCVCSAEKGNSVRVTSRMLSDILQGHHFVRDETATEDKIGVATGLAWTAVGGETCGYERKRGIGAYRKSRRCNEGISDGGAEYYPFACAKARDQ